MVVYKKIPLISDNTFPVNFNKVLEIQPSIEKKDLKRKREFLKSFRDCAKNFKIDA